MQTWQNWMKLALAIDPVYAFHNDPNAYPPGTVSILYLGGLVFGGQDTFLTTKYLLFAFSGVTSAVVGRWLRSWAAAWTVLAITGYLSVGIGLLDVLYLLPLSISLWALDRNRLSLASLFFASAVLIKWQPAILLPVLAVYLVKCWMGCYSIADRSRAIAASLLPGLAALAITVSVFGWSYLYESVGGATQQNMLSGNALNINWVWSALIVGTRETWGTVYYLYTSDVPTWVVTGARAFFFLTFALLVVLLSRLRMTYEQLLVSAMAASVLYGTFAVGSHQNHMILIMPVAVAIAVRISALRYVAILALSLPVVNVMWFYGDFGDRFGSAKISGWDPSIPGAVLFVIASLYVILSSLSFLLEQQRTSVES